MRSALLADVHANREALTACLQHAERAGCDRHVFLGDLVGYGADPAWVLATVMRLHERGAIVVQGNHDAAVQRGPTTHMNPAARQVADWTRRQLDAGQLAFLGALPLQHDTDECLFVHANAWAPAAWEYVAGAADAGRSLAATQRRLTFCGHVHDPALYAQIPGERAVYFIPSRGTPIPLGGRRRWLAIPGSVGQPRDGVPAACYALYDDRSLTLTFHRVAYDFEAAAAKIRAAGLPEQFVVLLLGNGGHA